MHGRSSCRTHDSLQDPEEKTTHTCALSYRVPSKESTTYEWMIVYPDADGCKHLQIHEPSCSQGLDLMKPFSSYALFR